LEKLSESKTGLAFGYPKAYIVKAKGRVFRFSKTKKNSTGFLAFPPLKKPEKAF